MLRTNNTDHSITDMDGKGLNIISLLKDLLSIHYSFSLVYNINDESDIVGYLTVSLSGITSLRTLLANN